jgi:Flp pilus assembly protein CpaB
VAIGVLAAVALWNWSSGVQDRADKNNREVPVFVVKKDVLRNMVGKDALDKQFIVQDKIQSKFKPATAVADPSAIEGFIAVNDIPAGSVLVKGMFASRESAQVGNADLLKGGKVAMTISVDQVRGVAGLIVPGDFVNIMVLPKATGGDTSVCDPANLAQHTQPLSSTGHDTVVYCTPAHYLYQKVQVLFVDKTTRPQPGQTTADNGTTTTVPNQNVNTGLLTVAVPPQAAQILASIGSDQFYLSLVSPDYTPVPLPPLNPYPSLLPGEDSAQLTPYGPNGLKES